MGTIHKIVDNLQTLRDAKITKLSTRYEEHSTWLNGEFSLIKKLVQQNNTQRQSTGSKNTQTSASTMPASTKATGAHIVTKPDVSAPAAITTNNIVAAGPFTAIASSSVSKTATVEPVPEAPPHVQAQTEPQEESRRNKRKSPEMALNAIKLSPEQKRNSTDFDKAAAEAGLPSDLGKLKKDILLKELEKRGHTELSMKSLKKDIQETLRALLINEHWEREGRHDFSAQELSTGGDPTSPEKPHLEPMKKEVADVVQSTASAEGVSAKAEEATSPRRGSTGSTIADFRLQLGKAAAPAETEEQKKQKAQSEFERRQSLSKARKSEVVDEEKGEEKPDEEVEEEEEEKVEEFVEQQVPGATPAAVVVAPPTMQEAKVVPTHTSPVKAQVIEQAPKPMAAAVPVAEVSPKRTEGSLLEEDTWMEVASPQPDHTISALENGISLEISGNSPQKNTQQPLVMKTAGTRVPLTLPGPAPAAPTGGSRTAVQVNSLMNLTSAMPPAAPVEKANVRSPMMKEKKGIVAEKAVAIEAATKKEKYMEDPALTMVRSLEAAELKKKQEAMSGYDHWSPQKKSPVKVAAPVTVAPVVAPKPAPVEAAPAAAVPAPAAVEVAKPAVKKGLFSFLAGKTPNEAEKNSTVKGTGALGASASATKMVVAAAAAPAVVKMQSPVAAPAPAPAVYKPVESVRTATPTRAPEPVRVPVVVASPQSVLVEDEYRIGGDDDSDGSGSGTDEDDEDKKKSNKIPDWARGAQLKEALERQYGMYGHTPVDPDMLFPVVQTCSLEEIFGAQEGRSGKYNHRSSSAKWEHDEITLVETRTYRKQMGLAA